MGYTSRVVDSEVSELLEVIGAVVLEGPKSVGKTATARQHSASEVLLDVDDNARQLALVDPALVLPGRTPRLIDEWQLEPRIWNYVRREVDNRGGAPGQFLLTGSAVPSDDASRHTGAGRMARIRMRPMSLFESGHSSGEVSLMALFDGAAPAGEVAPMASVVDVLDRICVGGWPTVAAMPPVQAQRVMRAYLAEIARTDINTVDGVRRDPARVQRVMRSLARNVATEAKIAGIASDVGDDGQPLDRETVGGYLSALERLMVVENAPAWAPELRSKATLRQTPKRHFVDPCLAVAALQTGPRQLLSDLNYAGFLFESLVVRDLRVYLQALGGRVLHYRDSLQHEADVVVQLDDGRWAAIEVKMGIQVADDAAASLHRFLAGLDLKACGEPAFLAVVTATGYAFRRPDGVFVLPLATLAP